MNRAQRLGRLGGLVAVAATPFAYLWVQMMINADVPLSFRVRLDMAIWMAVFGIPAMLAAWLLWRAWWRQAGARLSALDGRRRWRWRVGVGLVGPGQARWSPFWRWWAWPPAPWPLSTTWPSTPPIHRPAGLRSR